MGLSTDQFGRLSFCAGAGTIKGESTYQIGQIFQALENQGIVVQEIRFFAHAAQIKGLNSAISRH